MRSLRANLLEGLVILSPGESALWTDRLTV